MLLSLTTRYYIHEVTIYSKEKTPSQVNRFFTWALEFQYKSNTDSLLAWSQAL